MKVVEFQSQIGPDQRLIVPAEIAQSLPTGHPLRVLILIPEDESDREWEELAASDFTEGYAASDGIYDQVSVRWT